MSKIDFKKIEYYYWIGFNFFMRRIVGGLWLAGGGFATLWTVVILFNPSATIDIQGIPSADFGMKIIVCVMSLSVFVGGYFFVKMPRYFPQRIRQWMLENGKPL